MRGKHDIRSITPRGGRAAALACAACLAVLLAILVPAARATAMDIAVVVHPGAPMAQVTVDQLHDIYLGEMTYWNGARLVPVTFQNQTPLQTAFLEKVVHLSGNAYKTYWIKRIFREGGIPPLRVSSVDEMMELVAQTPGAIGFVPADYAAGTASVRKVLQLSAD